MRFFLCRCLHTATCRSPSQSPPPHGRKVGEKRGHCFFLDSTYRPFQKACMYAVPRRGSTSKLVFAENRHAFSLSPSLLIGCLPKFLTFAMEVKQKSLWLLAKQDFQPEASFQSQTAYRKALATEPHSSSIAAQSTGFYYGGETTPNYFGVCASCKSWRSRCAIQI